MIDCLENVFITTLPKGDIVILDKKEQAPFQEQIDNDIKKSEPEVKNNKDDALLNDSVDESKELEDEMFEALTK